MKHFVCQLMYHIFECCLPSYFELTLHQHQQFMENHKLMLIKKFSYKKVEENITIIFFHLHNRLWIVFPNYWKNFLLPWPYTFHIFKPSLSIQQHLVKSKKLWLKKRVCRPMLCKNMFSPFETNWYLEGIRLASIYFQ